jgi:hypothetical protein
MRVTIRKVALALFDWKLMRQLMDAALLGWMGGVVRTEMIRGSVYGRLPMKV